MPKEEPTPKEKRAKKDNILKRILEGRIVSLNFFARYWPHVFMVIVILIVFIANKYKYQTQLAQIMKLKTELNNSKTDCVNASSQYNSRIRESEMTHLIDSMKIDLIIPEEPPYSLVSNETKK